MQSAARIVGRGWAAGLRKTLRIDDNRRTLKPQVRPPIAYSSGPRSGPFTVSGVQADSLPHRS